MEGARCLPYAVAVFGLCLALAWVGLGGAAAFLCGALCGSLAGLGLWKVLGTIAGGGSHDG